jgi:SAM-dependent methyltransferase
MLGLRLNGNTPVRYMEPWREAFDTRVAQALFPGIRILDVGSGRTPTLPVESRPEGCYYVGLDLSQEELDRSPAGSYDATYTWDIVKRLPELEGQFDLTVSWQVLEHVKPLSDALENIRSYLRPGGQLVAKLSGGLSAFAIVNRAVPSKVGVWAMHRLLGREPSTVFPAYYDKCTYSGLQRVCSPWSSVEVIPRFKGGTYFAPLGPVRSAYLIYENWAHSRNIRNLATHYIVVATR